MTTTTIPRIAIIGFGEVGGIFGTDFAAQGIGVAVFDILLNSRKQRKKMLAKAQRCRVRAASDLRDCVHDAELVISAVTASSALDVAKEAGPRLRCGQIFVDINSVSPGTKRRGAQHVERNRAHFVEAAVMGAVRGLRLKAPMLLGGAHSVETAERLNAIGMNAAAFSEEIGVASAVKMCRSVIIKGLEALTVECLLAARNYGAEDHVLKSLDATYPSMGWKTDLPDYLISRVAEHGRRRAAEMREVAESLREVGVNPVMSLAIANRQESLPRAIMKQNLSFAGQSFSWRALADGIATARRPKRKSRT